MLDQLVRAGHIPDLILEEVSRIGDVEREKFLVRIAGHPLAPSISQQALDYDIPLRPVRAHNDEHCLAPIRVVDPGLLVLGGTRIIQGELLAAARDGVLNSHPGLLPECRGSASPAWSVYHDIPIGSSCHFCTAEIDQGDLVGRRELPVYRGDRYEDLCYRTLVMAGTLMTEALGNHADGRLAFRRRPQGPSPHPTFRNMPDELLAEVRRKLVEQTYAHYAD
jgi:phosphoribosylglycinamide formyltransferase-1